MTEPECKRQKTGSADEIVGLELTIAGRIFNCPLSTLRNTSGYFAARFGETGIPPGAERVDEHGRSIYYIPRDASLFENHILPYLLTNEPGDLPPFSEAPRLWRRLRAEAEFFVLDGLSDLLYVTKTCDRGDLQGRGVLHWLGTGKGSHEYRNPHAISAVHVGGWVDMTREELEEMNRPHVVFPPSTYWPPESAANTESRQALVQYKPKLKENQDLRRKLLAKKPCGLFRCRFSLGQFPVVVDLRDILLRPTAYSFRFDKCGMSYWNFEGSQDGANWDVLHEARDEPYLRLDQISEELIEKIHSDAAKLLTYVEKNLRHTWDITTDKFYRYFRFIGLGTTRNIDEEKRCMHGVGLELFGDIHEE